MAEPTQIKTDSDSISENTELKTQEVRSVKGEQAQQNQKGLESTEGVNAFGPETIETDSFLNALIENNQNKAPTQETNQAEVDVEALQQLIEEGADPTQLLEETAAGEGEPTDGGGIYIPTIDRTAEEVLADTGFDTAATESQELVEEEVLITEPVVIEPPINEQDPIAGAPITLRVDDQNLANGTTPAGDDFESNSIVFTEGSDAITSIVFGADLSSLGGGLTWTRISDNEIVGKDGTDTIIRLDLSVTGTTAKVTATLNDNYDSHPDITTDDLQSLGSVGVIATDTDGDVATGIVNVEVSDDVPVVNTAMVNIALEEEGLTGGIDENENPDLPGSYSGNLSTDANVSWGADGFGSITSVTVGTGTEAVTAGTPLVIYFDAKGAVQTSAASAAASLTVNSTGAYTFEVLTAMDHVAGSAENTALLTGLPTLALNAEDGDGDVISGGISLNVSVQDDVPVVNTAMVNIALEEEGLTGGIDENENPDLPGSYSGNLSTDANVSWGADGFGSITSVTVGTGTEAVTAGTPLVIYFDAKGAVQTSAASAAASLTVNSTGAYTFEVLTAMDHVAGSAENTALLTGLPTLALNAEDGDGDVISGGISLNVSVQDDVPTASDPENAFLANEVGSTLTGSLNSLYGADNKGTSRFAMTDESQVFADDGTTPVTVAGVNIYYYIDPNNSSHVVASLADPTTFDSANVFDGSLSQNDSWVFEVTLDVAPDEYTVLMYQSVDAPFVNVSVGAATREASGPTQWIILQNSATENLVELTSYEASDQTAYNSWLASGTDVAATPFKDMNGSLAGWGVNNNNHDQFEIVHIEFGDGNNATDDSDAPTTSGVTDLPLVNGVTLDFSTNYSTGNIIDIKVNYQNSTSSEQFVIGTAEGSSGDEYYFNGTLLIIDGGLLALDYLEAGVAIGSGKFNITDVSRSLKTGAVDIDLDIETIDDDGDVASSTIDIQVSGADLGTTFIGTTEGDVLSGGSGNDILIGGLSDDTLSGGSGNDTFKWQAGETGTDTIKDWGTGTDKLDLSELLQNETTATLDDFLNFSYATSNTTLTIDVDGSGNDSDQVIVFEGVDLTQLGNNQAIITSLLGTTQLITD